MTTELDWYGCATFRLRTAGLTVFLDAYIDRAPTAAGAGRSAADVEECDWVVIGHSHFDHLFGAERIMANTPATLVGSYETVRVMEAAGVPPDRMLCVAGGETIYLGQDVRVSVYPSLHSCVWSHRSAAAADQACVGDLGVSLQDQHTRMAELGSLIASGLDPLALEHLLGGMAGHSHRGTVALCCSTSRRPMVHCSTRTPVGTGPESSTCSNPMSRSSPRRAVPTSTDNRSRAR